MPIHELLQERDCFSPEQVAVVGKAFEEILVAMALNDRKDLVTRIVAEKVVELAQAGVRDPVRLKHLTIETFKKNQTFGTHSSERR